MKKLSRQNWILLIICISYFMVILDNSIVFTGLPQIEASMDFTPSMLAWVTNAYVLVFGGFLLLIALIIAVVLIARKTTVQTA